MFVFFKENPKKTIGFCVFIFLCVLIYRHALLIAFTFNQLVFDAKLAKPPTNQAVEIIKLSGTQLKIKYPHDTGNKFTVADGVNYKKMGNELHIYMPVRHYNSPFKPMVIATPIDFEYSEVIIPYDNEVAKIIYKN